MSLTRDEALVLKQIEDNANNLNQCIKAAQHLGFGITLELSGVAHVLLKEVKRTMIYGADDVGRALYEVKPSQGGQQQPKPVPKDMPNLSCQYTLCVRPVYKEGLCKHHHENLPVSMGGVAPAPNQPLAPLAGASAIAKGSLCTVQGCHYFALSGSPVCGQHQPNLKVRAPYDDSPISLGVCHWDGCHSKKAAQSNHCVAHHASHGNGGWVMLPADDRPGNRGPDAT